MTTEHIEGGALFAKVEDRTVSGLLLPYGEFSRLNATGNRPTFFGPGSVKLPRDVSIVSANVEHNRYHPVARATNLAETDAGITATFSVADTEEGDDLLLQVSEGRLSKLSAEVRDLDYSVSPNTATLTGAAFVQEGAFASAGLFSLAVELSEPDITAAIADAQEAIRKATEHLAALTPETPEDTASEETPATPTPENTEEEITMADEATVPSTVANYAATSAPRSASVHDVATAMALFSRSGDKSLINALDASDQPNGEVGMFALSDVKLTTSGSVGVNIQQPQWLGQLWAGRTFERRVIPLMTHGDLTSFTVKGFRWTTKPAMATWAGDKAAITSNAPATESYSVTAARYAGGHDIAREYRDFDVPEFWDAYFAAMTDSYASLTDSAALTALIAGATAVTAGAVPTGINSGLVSLVDGALAVLPVGTPTFAIVASDVWRSLQLTKEIDRLAFFNSALGLEEGQTSNFKVVPHASMTAGKVLVGVKSAARTLELPGSPIRTEALDQIKGGIDEALFGYAATVIDNAAGLALVTPAA